MLGPATAQLTRRQPEAPGELLLRTGTEMPRPVHIDAEILGGIPVFAGTRVPFQTLMDYLKEEQALSAFLADFPTVTREQAVAALEAAEDAYGVAVRGGKA